MISNKVKRNLWLTLAIMSVIAVVDRSIRVVDGSLKTPFGRFASRYDSILVFYVLDHMFCLVDMDDFTSVTVKLESAEIADLRLNRSSASKPLNLNEKILDSAQSQR